MGFNDCKMSQTPSMLVQGGWKRPPDIIRFAMALPIKRPRYLSIDITFCRRNRLLLYTLGCWEKKTKTESLLRRSKWNLPAYEDIYGPSFQAGDTKKPYCLLLSFRLVEHIHCRPFLPPKAAFFYLLSQPGFWKPFSAGSEEPFYTGFMFLSTYKCTVLQTISQREIVWNFPPQLEIFRQIFFHPSFITFRTFRRVLGLCYFCIISIKFSCS